MIYKMTLKDSADDSKSNSYRNGRFYAMTSTRGSEASIRGNLITLKPRHIVCTTAMTRQSFLKRQSVSHSQTAESSMPVAVAKTFN